jgi:hypothetical protein
MIPVKPHRRRAIRFSWLPTLLAALLLSAAPSIARAADEEVKPEARELGYTRDVGLPKAERGSAALSYFILIGTTLLAVGVLFKNANRTHLD